MTTPSRAAETAKSGSIAATVAALVEFADFLAGPLGWDITRIIEPLYLEAFVTGVAKWIALAFGGAAWYRNREAPGEPIIVGRRETPPAPVVVAAPAERREAGPAVVATSPPPPVRSGFRFGESSERHLASCHPDLQTLARRALSRSPHDFAVICGARTTEQQRALYDAGKSLTMNSRHLQRPALALDIAVLGPDGRATWQVEPYYRETIEAFRDAARDLNIPIRCGIDWSEIIDAGHVELDRSVYPDAPPYRIPET